MTNKILTLKEVSTRLNIPLSTTHYYARNGVIPTEKLVGRYVVDEDKIPEIEHMLSIHSRFKRSAAQ